MTALTKILVASLLLLVVGAAYQIHLLSSQRAQVQALTRKTAALAAQNRHIRDQRDQTLAALSATQTATEPAISAQNQAAQDSILGAWLGRVNRLERCLQQAPEKSIPEMRYLDSNDWLSVTMDNPLDTDAKIRAALGRLRSLAKAKPQVAGNLSNALQAYRKANDGLLPSDPMLLRPYLNPQLADDLLRRYEPAPQVAGENDADGLVRAGMRFLGSGPVVLQEKAPVDGDFDTWFGFLEKGGWATLEVSQLGRTVSQAMKTFAQANDGQAPTTPEQLLPYLATPVEPKRLKEYWEASRR